MDTVDYNTFQFIPLIRTVSLWDKIYYNNYYMNNT